jgi:hypothetical protein
MSWAAAGASGPAREIDERMTMRKVAGLVGALLLWIASVPGAGAEGWDLTLYGGASLPTYEQTFRFGLPAVPAIPNVQVTSAGDLVLDAKGGTAFGGALSRRIVGPVALEARVDTATVKLQTEGASFGLSASIPPFPPVSGSLTLSPATFDLKRFTVFSLNARLQSGGPVKLFLSGGVSYLPSLESSGTITATLDVPGVPNLPVLAGDLQLVATPTESKHAFGANAGLGLRIALGGNLTLMGEARVFGFREFDLAFALASSPSLPVLDDAIGGLDTVRFDPVYFHAAAGLTVSF